MEDLKKNTKKKIENKIKKLIFKINYHDALYYNYNTQEISDYEYDILIDLNEDGIININDVILFINIIL